MQCAGCGEEMIEESLDSRYGPNVEVDLCHGCDSIWFDHRESLQLSPGAVVRLCQLMHQRRSPERRALQNLMHCPRCGERLKSTWDMQGTTRFNYFRCPADHGRFITFFQFLREKNIVRALDPKQLNELRRHVKVVTCSNCGAPVNLEKTSICEHCNAALSTVDPTQMEATLRKLQQEEVRRSNVDADQLAVALAMDKLKAEQMHERIAQESLRDAFSSSGGIGWDLLRIGLKVAFEIFTNM